MAPRALRELTHTVLVRRRLLESQRYSFLVFWRARFSPLCAKGKLRRLGSLWTSLVATRAMRKHIHAVLAPRRLRESQRESFRVIWRARFAPLCAKGKLRRLGSL